MYTFITCMRLSMCLLGMHVPPCCQLDLKMWSLYQTDGSINSLDKSNCEQRWRNPLLPCLHIPKFAVMGMGASANVLSLPSTGITGNSEPS